MGIFDFLQKLSSADGTREAMINSYHKHRRSLDQSRLPMGTSPHDAALYGALGSRYKASGANPDAMEPFIWMELIPFRFLPEQHAPEVLAEYVVWKEKETHHEARSTWLSQQLLIGAKAASNDDHDMVREAYAMGPDGQYSSPWTELVPRQLL